MASTETYRLTILEAGHLSRHAAGMVPPAAALLRLDVVFPLCKSILIISLISPNGLGPIHRTSLYLSCFFKGLIQIQSHSEMLGLGLQLMNWGVWGTQLSPSQVPIKEVNSVSGRDGSDKAGESS